MFPSEVKMLSSDLIQMLLDAQKQAGEEVEIRGAIIDNENGLKVFNQCTIVGAELFHNPNTDEQHIKLIVHDDPFANGDKLYTELRNMIHSGHEWKDRKFINREEISNV
jgi:hypothetical protein